MSSYETDAMLETLSLKLRDAEVRRAEAERAHQVTKNVSSFNVTLFLSKYLINLTEKKIHYEIGVSIISSCYYFII